MRGRYWLERIGTLVVVTAGILLVMVTAAAVILTNNGFRALVMQTDSMHPLLARGDIVFVEPVSPNQIGSGDIIAFVAPTGRDRLVTHRVVEINDSPEGPAFTTQGDNNNAVDPWEFRYVEDGWRYAFSIPYVGHAILAAQGPHGKSIGFAALFVLTCVILWPAIPAGFDRPRWRPGRL
jgi:signal peptidase I